MHLIRSDSAGKIEFSQGVAIEQEKLTDQGELIGTKYWSSKSIAEPYLRNMGETPKRKRRWCYAKIF